MNSSPSLKGVTFFDNIDLSHRYWMKFSDWNPEWLLDEDNAEIGRISIEKVGYEKICGKLGAIAIDSWREYHLLTIHADVIVCILRSSASSSFMTLQHLEPQLLALTANEEAQAMQILAQSLGNPWRGIEKTPGVCGGDACIARTRIPVWVLVNARNIGISEAQLLKDYPTLSATDLTNTWVYATAHPEEIATAIRKNEEA